MNLQLLSHGLGQSKSQNLNQKLQSNLKRLLLKILKSIGYSDIETRKPEIMHFSIQRDMLFIRQLLWV